METGGCITPGNVVYLDYAAACPMVPAVIDSLPDLARRTFFNPHAANKFSEDVRRACLRAADRLLDCLAIPGHSADVLWTSGGTEANNLGCIGCLRGLAPETWAVESTAHPSVLEPCCRYAHGKSDCCRKLEVDADGNIILPRIESRLVAPGFAAVLHVNNETGVVQDLSAIRQWMNRHAPRSRLFVDAAQSFGKLDIPWRRARIDLLAVSGRKIGGPPAVGALIRRKDVPLMPLFFGGGQQSALRPGTLDVAGILGFVQAAEIAFSRQASFMDRAYRLNARLRQELRDRIGRTTSVCILSPSGAVPYILTIALPGYEGAVIVRALAEQGVVVGAGSACSAESAEPSRVLTAMGVPERTARGALRISLGWASSMADIDAFVDALHQALIEY